MSLSLVRVWLSKFNSKAKITLENGLDENVFFSEIFGLTKDTVNQKNLLTSFSHTLN